MQIPPSEYTLPPAKYVLVQCAVGYDACDEFSDVSVVGHCEFDVTGAVDLLAELGSTRVRLLRRIYDRKCNLIPREHGVIQSAKL